MVTKYNPTAEIMDRVHSDFTYHPPRGDQAERYEHLRSLGHGVARQILSFTPPGREQSLALTKLEEAIFWANAAIARNELFSGNAVTSKQCE